nr:MAG: Prophage endopeptidase tail [Bacteriophage sp.]
MANEINPILNIYNEDGTPFHDISLRKHTFSTIVMSLNDKIEGEFYYKDNSLSFTLQEYVEYKGIKYILKNPPVVVRKGMTSENSEAKGMTKYSCTFYHEMIELYNIPFTDIAISSSEESYRSEKRTFSWIGTLSMFVQKINSCLVGTKWTCKLQPTFVDDGTMSDVLSFSNQFISDVCKTAYETWKVPFVVDGYTIWFGKPSKEILDDENKPYIFKFGQGVGLKNNDCTPKNNKVITRIAGYGSNINIPYGYPIITDADGNRIEHPYTRDTLMPSVYVEAVRNKVLFGSKEPLIDYYDADSSYPTPINPLAPVFHIQEFSSIQPTIKGMTYKGQAIDLFKEVIVPEGGWDDYIDPETGEVRQSYFDVTLYPLGFDLYAQAAVTSGMTFSMKSGDTLGANYEVAVDWEDVKKNFYVTDEAGNIVFKPNGEQRDYAKYPDSTDQAITIKLTKDLDTFGTIMPSKFQQVKTGDKFVILHIEMPQAYIDKAQERLDVAMKRYMLENNMPLYDYPLSFDEHFLETNQAILAQIKPNTIVRFLYKDNEDAMELSVKEMSIQYGTNPLPTYNITLTDEVSIVLNQIGQIADGLSKLGSQVAQLQAIYGLDIVGELNKKLSRVKDDTAQGMITFLRGLKVGSFVTGSTGGIFYADTDGKSHAELDYLTVRMKAMFYALEIIKTGVIGGRQMITPGGAIECIKIEDRNDILDEEGNKTGENIWDYWRCYFYQDDGTEALDNRFRAGDMALAQDFNIKEGVYENVSNHYFWRLVVNVGTNYIDISKTDADAASDAPRVGDTICQLGNKTFVDANGVTHVEDKTRQNAIIFSAVDTFSPSMTLYAGINSYSYLNKEYVSYGVDKTTNLAYMNVYGNSYIGARDKSSYMKFDTVTGVEIKGKLVTKSGKDVEETFNSFQDQIDGVKETWYGEYTPTLTNQPAVDWNTEALKKRHEGDVFTNIQEYVDDETTPDAGKSWRWVKTGDTWGWKQIADNDTSKAYLEAAKAQKAAEEAKKEANDAKQTVTNMKDFTDEAFKDGIVDRQEAAAIEKYLNSIKSIQKSVAESYSKVYANPLLSGTAKVELKTAYDGFNVATTELITAIDDAIADGVATSTEVALVDGRYDTFNTKYGDFIAYLNAANNFIQDKINTSAEDAKKAAEEAKKAADAAKAAADNVAGAVGDLNEYVDGAFKDGIIDISEAQSIERYINIVNNTKSEVKATFDKLYANTYLDGNAKTGLNSSYTALNTSITNLLNSINTAIADGKTTAAEKADVDAKYASFNTAYASFNTAVETANKAIQDKLKTFADDAKALAESAKAEAEAAKQRLDKWAEDGVISPTEKQSIKDEIVRIDADKTNITAGYTLYSLGSPTGYLNAHSNYRAVLVTLSASTPENITIPSDFASKQSAYYNQRTAALNAISDAAKAAVDTVKKDLAGYEYLKKAWKESTTIEGGVIQNALNMLGYTDPVAGFKVMSGMNGVYDATKVGGGIASWYGGSMKDRADYTEANMPSDVAKAIIRMDGSGYLASGAVWWGTDGVFHADPQSFIIKENQLGDYVSLFQIVYRSGTPKTISYMIPQYPMQKLTVSDYIEIGTTGYRIGVDSANNAIKVYKEDGSAVNFYASGAVSAKGISSGSGGGGGGLIDTVYGYSSLGGTFADSTLSDTFNAYTINKLASRITELEKNGGGGTGIAGIKVNSQTYVPDTSKYITLPNYPSTTITGTGNVLTNATYDNSTRVLTLTKGNIATTANHLERYAQITSTAIDTVSTFTASKTSVWEANGTAYGTTGANDTVLNIGSAANRLFQLRAASKSDDFYFRGVGVSAFRAWYKIWHAGNLNPSKITYLGNKSDAQWVVILLWKDAQLYATHRINGKLYTENNGATRYQYAEIDLFFSRWSTSNYNFYGNFDTAGIGSDWSLVTCTYNGEKWWALRHTNRQAVSMYFMGTTTNISFTKVHYYTSNSGTVVNSEVNGSIASKGDSISVRSVNGSPYALQKDINALSSVYVKKAGDTMTGNLVVGTGQTTARISSQWGEFYIDISSSTTGGWERGFCANINNSSTPVKFGFYGAGQSVSYAYAGLYSNPWQKWDNNTSTISTELVVNKNIIGLNREFSLLSGNEHFQHRYWSSEGSYSYEVFLLLPIPATTNLGGLNTIDGTISGYTNGANQCFWVDVKISTIYNITFWNIKSISSFSSNQYVLKKCKYNDIWYYCIEIPYRDNRMDSYYFRGVIRSTIAGGLSTITLPYRIKYKTKANGNNAEVINNSEINSSLSTTLTQGGITYVSSIENTYYQNIKPHLSNSIILGTTDLRWKCVYSYNLDISSTSTFSGKATFNGGLSGTLTGSLSGNATTATTLQTSRTINGTSFNGSANITTSYWGTTRTIWGQSVNGSANVSGAMTGVTSITATGLIRTSNLFSAGDGGSDNAYGYYNCTRPNTANTGYVCYAFVRSGTYAFGLGYYNNEIVLSGANTSRQFNARWLQLNSSRLLINGNIEATGAVTAKSSSSDIRLKKNIKEYNALDIINKLKSVKYYWNDTAKANSPIFNDNEEHYGLIAQDLLINGYSQWVSNCFKDYYVIQYERLIPVLWRGIQQVDNEVATLKKKIATLEKELSSVKRQLSL